MLGIAEWRLLALAWCKMINQKRAFNRYTTAPFTIEVYVEGFYDDKNNWQSAALMEPKKFKCTPIAFGDRDSGTTGQQLKATDIGERQPAFMQIHSRIKMPMKSVITVYGIRYKVVQIRPFTAAGFHCVVAAKELEK